MYWDEEFAFDEYGELSWDLWAELADCQSLWSDTYRGFWGLDGDSAPGHLTEQQWKSAKTTDGLAEVTLKMALALSVQGAAAPGTQQDWAQEDLRKLRRALRSHTSTTPQARDRISLQLAEEALDQLKSSTGRVVRMVGLIRGKGLSERASQYMYRAARLYVWGFEPECAIMCRSALEAALAAALEAHVEMDHAQPSLDALIELAGRNGLLDGYEVVPRARKGWRARRGTVLWTAQQIQRTANRAAHHFPLLGQDSDDLRDAFSALRELTVVLNALFPLRRRE